MTRFSLSAHLEDLRRAVAAIREEFDQEAFTITVHESAYMPRLLAKIQELVERAQSLAADTELAARLDAQGGR